MKITEVLLGAELHSSTLTYGASVLQDGVRVPLKFRTDNWLRIHTALLSDCSNHLESVSLASTFYTMASMCGFFVALTKQRDFVLQ